MCKLEMKMNYEMKNWSPMMSYDYIVNYNGPSTVELHR